MNNHSLVQLQPYEFRTARKAEKRRLLLGFLQDEVYTSADVVAALLGITSRQAVHKSLMQMEREGLIRRETVMLPDLTKQTVWGITSHGMGWAYDPDKDIKPRDRIFEPSRIGLSVLRHTLDLQHIRIAAERAGWSKWQASDRIGKWQRGRKRPDAIACDPEGRIVAIEVERSFKSLKRYEAILSDYLQQIKQGHVNMVVWVSPSMEFAERLRRMLTGITEVRVAGQKISIDPARHHQNLFFTHYGKWPNY